MQNLPIAFLRGVCRLIHFHTFSNLVLIVTYYLRNTGWRSFLDQHDIGLSFISVCLPLREQIAQFALLRSVGHVTAAVQLDAL